MDEMLRPCIASNWQTARPSPDHWALQPGLGFVSFLKSLFSCATIIQPNEFSVKRNPTNTEPFVEKFVFPGGSVKAKGLGDGPAHGAAGSLTRAPPHDTLKLNYVTTRRNGGHKRRTVTRGTTAEPSTSAQKHAWMRNRR